VDNLSLAQWSKDPRAYSAAFNRQHRVEMRATSEIQQHHVSNEDHNYAAHDAFLKASPTPGVVTRGALDAAKKARHG